MNQYPSLLKIDLDSTSKNYVVEYASLYSQSIPNLFDIGTSSIWIQEEQKFLFTKSDNSNFLYSVFAYEDFEFLSKRKNPADNCGLV